MYWYKRKIFCCEICPIRFSKSNNLKYTCAYIQKTFSLLDVFNYVPKDFQEVVIKKYICIPSVMKYLLFLKSVWKDFQKVVFRKNSFAPLQRRNLLLFKNDRKNFQKVLVCTLMHTFKWKAFCFWNMFIGLSVW